MSEKDKANLLAIIDSAQKVQIFIDGISDSDEFYSDVKTFDAVLMNFVIIGESVSRLSIRLKNDNPDIQWRQIKALRNIVAHDYFGVDAEEVWQIIQTHIPELVLDIQSLVDDV